VLWIFIALKKTFTLDGFEPMNLGSNSKHANLYTTDATYKGYNRIRLEEQESLITYPREVQAFLSYV
jgi:hypothetical protein